MELSHSQLEKLKYIRVPAKYYLATMSKIPDPTGDGLYDFKPKIQEYLDSVPNDPRGLFIYGEDLGHGKTALAAIILKKYASKGLYGTWVEYKEIQNIEYGYEVFEGDLLLKAWFRTAPVLVVDELDFEETNPKVSKTRCILFENLLRYRCVRNLPTIITSNHSPKAVLEAYPQAYGIMSVVSDCSISVQVVGKNWRHY